MKYITRDKCALVVKNINGIRNDCNPSNQINDKIKSLLFFNFISRDG